MEKISHFVKINRIDLTPRNARKISLLEVDQHLYVGAHIATGTSEETHFHHGIVSKVRASPTDQIEVIHFVGPTVEEARIQKTTLAVFIAGDAAHAALGDFKRNFFIVDYAEDTQQRQQLSNSLAMKFLKHSEQIAKELLPYDPVGANCEHFAVYCRTGKWQSDQVEKLISIAAEVVVFAAKALGSVIEKGSTCS